jgi:hypothetical protein
MGAIFVFNPSTRAVTTAAAIICCIALPALANSGPVCQDKLAMNTGAPSTRYQDAEVKQAIEALKAVEKQAGTKIKAKKVLRHNYRSAGNILILGGAEAFPM